MIVDGIAMRAAEVIEVLVERDGLECVLGHHKGFCKNRFKFTEENPPTIDHILPKSYEGEDSLKNFQIAHKECNSKRGNRLYLEDGTLEVLTTKKKPAKVVKRDPCETCFEGRLLIANEICPDCGIDAQPKTFPKWAQRESKDCDHNQYHCKWCVIGVYERTPAYISAL